MIWLPKEKRKRKTDDGAIKKLLLVQLGEAQHHHNDKLKFKQSLPHITISNPIGEIVYGRQRKKKQ